MIKIFKKNCSIFFSIIGICISLLYSLLIIISKFPIFQKCEVLIYMPEGGFAHTIVAPDIQRRLFPGKYKVFLFFSEFNRHNPLIKKLYQDIKMIFFPLNPGIKIFNFLLRFRVSSWYKKNASQIMLKIILFFNRKTIHLPMLDLYQTLPEIELFSKKEVPDWIAANLTWPINYFNLIKNQEDKPIHLPLKMTGNINDRIINYIQKYKPGFSEKIKACSFYLRQKGRSSDNDKSSFYRCGSVVHDYLDSLQQLIKAGYFIYLRGDVELPSTFIREMAPYVISCKQIKITKNLFEIFAATEVDIAINEAGGGAWFSVINRQPSLILNGFPFGYGLPWSTVLYKTVKDQDNRLLEYHDIFEKYTYQYQLEPNQLFNNSASQISAAVRYFLESLSSDADFLDEDKEKLSTLSEFSWLKQADARISKAWFDIFEREENG